MKRILIRVNDNLLKVELTKNHMVIFNSHLIKSPLDMKFAINEIRSFVENEDYVINSKNITSIIQKWRCYNFLYSFGLFRKITDNFVLKNEILCYKKVIYFICSLFYPYYK